MASHSFHPDESARLENLYSHGLIDTPFGHPGSLSRCPGCPKSCENCLAPRVLFACRLVASLGDMPLDQIKRRIEENLLAWPGRKGGFADDIIFLAVEYRARLQTESRSKP